MPRRCDLNVIKVEFRLEPLRDHMLARGIAPAPAD
jgi:hypothetical protein